MRWSSAALLWLGLGALACRAPWPDDTASPDTAEDTAVEDTELPGVTWLPANDRAYLPAARGLIGAATERVVVVMYLVQPVSPVTTLLADLEAAAARGVAVRVLLDEEGNDVDDVLLRLNAAGVDARLDSPVTTSHNKLLIADDAVLLGSHNWTGPAMDRNVEGAVQIHASAVADHYVAYAEALWDGVTPALPALEVEGVVPLHDRGVEGALIACVDGATSAVDVLMYAVSWRAEFEDSAVGDVLDAVEAAHARGVTVRVLLDDSDWIRDNAINDAAIARLEAAGVTVRHTPNDRVTHAKVLRCDDQVIVSDANWSHSGLRLMNGTSVSITRAPLAAAYRAWFDGMWER